MLKAFAAAFAGSLVGSLIFASSPASAQPASAASAPSAVRSLAGVTEYRLDNGLQVLLMPVPGAGRTFVTVTYKVGSRMEGPAEAGMAHLLEHVTFHGARATGGGSEAPLVDISVELKKLDVSFNGSTTYDRTDYTSNFAASEGTLSQVLALEADRMSGARLAQADFDKEKPIVLNEMGLGADKTEQQMLQGLQAGAFTQHPYRRPIIGFSSDIENLSLPTLRGFYEKYYRPDNAVLTIAGEFDPAQALAAAVKRFASLKVPATPVPEFSLSEPTQTEPRVVTLRARGTAIAVAYHVPGLADPQAAAVMVLGQLLLVTRSNISEEAVRTGGATLDWRPSRDPFLVSVVLPLPGTASRDAGARAKLLDEAQSWAEALERASFSSNSDERYLTVMIERARSQVSQELHAPGAASAWISNAVGAGDWRLAFKLLDELNRLKPYELARVADTYVRAKNRTLALGVTDPAVTGVRVDEKPLTGLAGWFSKPISVDSVKDTSAAVGEIKTPGAATGASGGEAFDTDPVQLDHNARWMKLPSGILLATLNRQTPDDRVSVEMRLRWGAARRMAGEPGWRGLSQELLEAGSDGIKRLNGEQIAYIKAKTQADISVQSGPQTLLVRMTVPRQHLQVALMLVSDMLQAPDLPADYFKSIKTRTLNEIAGSMHGTHWAPELERQHRMQALGLQLGDPGYAPSPAELQSIWQKLDIDTVSAFAKHYWSANDLQLSVVGPLPDHLLGIIEGDFGSWKKPEAPPFERLVPSFKPEAGARFVSTRKAAATSTAEAAPGTNGSAHIGYSQSFPLNERDPEALPLFIGTRILVGSGAGGSRLLDRLRVHDGISYNVSDSLYVPREGSAANVHITATAAPENALRAEHAMHEEIERLLKDGITPAELDTARREYLDARRNRLSNDGSLAAALLAQLDSNEGFAPAQAREDAAVKALSVESVNAALRKLLLPEHWVVVITGAEARHKTDKSAEPAPEAEPN